MSKSGRFGITFRSIDNYVGTYKKELMVNHLTGEVSIRTPESDVISYNYISRTKNFIDNLTLSAINVDIKGDMYKIELHDTIMPAIAPFDTNILNNEISIPATTKKVLVALDMDTVLFNADTITKDLIGMDIEVVFSVENNLGIEEVKVKNSIDFVNLYTHDLTRFINEEEQVSISNIILKSIKIFNSTGHQSEKLRNILNNIFIIIEE